MAIINPKYDPLKLGGADTDQSKSLIALSASNKIITSNMNATEYSTSKTVFASDTVLDLPLYGTYICELDLIVDLPTYPFPGSLGVMAFINGSVVPLSSEMQMTFTNLNWVSVYKVFLAISRMSLSRICVSGYGHGVNGAVVQYPHASEFYGSANFNVCVRFTDTQPAGNKIVVKSARLYKLNKEP